MIDDTCFYIGSQNMYESNLAEWGLIVDDEAAAQQVINDYWQPLWAVAKDYACDGDGMRQADPDAAQGQDVNPGGEPVQQVSTSFFNRGDEQNYIPDQHEKELLKKSLRKHKGMVEKIMKVADAARVKEKRKSVCGTDSVPLEKLRGGR